MRRTYLLTASGVFAIAALLFSLAPAQEAGAGRKGAPAWEYRTLPLTDVVNFNEALNNPKKVTDAIDKRFNELGQDGWEIATSMPGAVVFKRPKR